MSEYCSNCSIYEGEYDIDLVQVALDLEKGHSQNILCEGCNIKAIYKDETGLLYLAKEIEGEVELQETTIEELMS